MFTKPTGHVWHMVLMVAIVVAVLRLGVGVGGVFVLALLACAAMMVALVWIAVRPTRLGAVDPSRTSVSAPTATIRSASDDERARRRQAVPRHPTAGERMS